MVHPDDIEARGWIMLARQGEAADRQAMETRQLVQITLSFAGWRRRP